MSEETHTVRYGSQHICKKCERDFSVFDDHRKIIIESDGDDFPAAEYFLCNDCTSRVLEPLEGESPGMRDFS